MQAGWGPGAVLNIDFDQLDAAGLGDWAPSPSPVVVTNQWPAGTTVTNVLRVVHDDGNYAAAVDQNVEIDSIVGLGMSHVEIALAPNNLQGNGGVSGAAAYQLVASGAGSQRRIFVELEIS